MEVWAGYPADGHQIALGTFKDGLGGEVGEGGGGAVQVSGENGENGEVWCVCVCVLGGGGGQWVDDMRSVCAAALRVCFASQNGQPNSKSTPSHNTKPPLHHLPVPQPRV